MTNLPRLAANLFTLRNETLQVTLSDYGARIVSLHAPDRLGTQANVVLGHSTLEDYASDRHSYMGAIVGRFANRIAKGRFRLDGVVHQLATNNGPNNLHGGPEGFDRLVWQPQELPDAMEFTVVSPAGDQGFPGTLTVTARYTLAGPMLRLDLSAVSDAPTVINLASHAYFNLSGSLERTIEDHEMQIFADRYTETDQDNIPLGNLAPVSDTPFDFRAPRHIGEQIQIDHPQLRQARGFDHNYVLNSAGPSGTPSLAAIVLHPSTGRTLTVHTTEPGMQFYTGNYLVEPHAPRTGFCLEAQHFADSPNQPQFPSTVLRPGEIFRSATTFTFSASE